MAQTTATPPTVAAVVERLTIELRQLVSLLSGSLLTGSMPTGSMPTAPDPATIAMVEAAGRLMDAARVHAAAPLARNPLAAERLGYASPVAAVSALAQVCERTARARLAVASGITADLSISGAPLSPAHPRLGAALDTGQIGLDAAALITKELDAVSPRVPVDTLLGAEAIMVNLAAGFDATGEHAALPVSVDYLSAEIRLIGATIDPDGAMPREDRATRRRSFRIGPQDDDGLVPVSGRLLPELGGLLRGMTEALRRSPRFVDSSLEGADGLAGAGDSRTPGQRCHDALAEILAAAAATAGMPRLDGQAVTVLVTVRAEDYDRAEALDSDPIGTMSGSCFPVSRAQIERFVDAGGLRTVTMTATGAVTGISSIQRCFTAAQRLAIAARDGYRCSTPGCTSPHYWLQAHHVIPDREGGPTVTGNGILLCYWHHRRVDDGPWQYRMTKGLPEVRGPGVPGWARLRPPAAMVA